MHGDKLRQLSSTFNQYHLTDLNTRYLAFLIPPQSDQTSVFLANSTQQNINMWSIPVNQKYYDEIPPCPNEAIKYLNQNTMSFWSAYQTHERNLAFYQIFLFADFRYMRHGNDTPLIFISLFSYEFGLATPKPLNGLDPLSVFFSDEVFSDASDSGSESGDDIWG